MTAPNARDPPPRSAQGCQNLHDPPGDCASSKVSARRNFFVRPRTQEEGSPISWPPTSLISLPRCPTCSAGRRRRSIARDMGGRLQAMHTELRALSLEFRQLSAEKDPLPATQQRFVQLQQRLRVHTWPATHTRFICLPGGSSFFLLLLPATHPPLSCLSSSCHIYKKETYMLTKHTLSSPEFLSCSPVATMVVATGCRCWPSKSHPSCKCTMHRQRRYSADSNFWLRNWR